MDLAKQLQHLAEAEAHVACGAKRVLDQEMRVADFELRGQDPSLARPILETLRRTQAQFITHRAPILRELGL
jgi:hypothetical protein